jgi:cytochrome c
LLCAGRRLGAGELQGMQRSAETVHVELCRADLQDRIRPLHEKLQEMIERDPKPRVYSKGNPMLKLIALAAALTFAPRVALAQDVAAGGNSFKKCGICHSIGEGATNKIGPELNGLDGRKAGTAEGFSYSDANKNSGITWNEASFKEYIRDPSAKVPGTKMIFAGIKNDKEIDDLWAYLQAV